MMASNNESGFPILYGRRITNTRDFIDAQTAAMRDLLAGRISVREANAVNREARQILKAIQAVMSCRELGRRASKNLVG